MKIVIEGDQHPMARREPYECALKVKVKFYRKLQPASKAYGTVDNLLKGLFDGMTGIVFKDNSQIVKVEASKYQDKEKPRREVEVKPLRGQI